MAEAKFSFVEDDTASVLRVTCTNDLTGGAIDLTASTVTLQWKTSKGVLQERTMTHVDTVNGIAEYKFIAGELQPPAMEFEVKITDSGGFEMRSLDVIYELVRKKMK